MLLLHKKELTVKPPIPCPCRPHADLLQSIKAGFYCLQGLLNQVVISMNGSHSCRTQLGMCVRLTHTCMTFHGVRVNVGTHVQRQWIEGAVSEGLGEEQLQG